MNIFYMEKDKFLNKMPLTELEKYSDGKEYKSQEKYLEHLCGLYLVKTVAENIYGESDVEIGLKNSKPCFKNSNLQFSISHSGNIVAVAFSTANTGFDVEYMTCRNYEKIMSRIKNTGFEGTTANASDRENFYKFWTTYEAEYKLGAKAVSRFTREVEKDYMFTSVGDYPVISDFAIYKIN